MWFLCCSKFHLLYVKKLQILCTLKHSVGLKTQFMDVLGLSLNYLSKSAIQKLNLLKFRHKLPVRSFKSCSQIMQKQTICYQQLKLNPICKHQHKAPTLMCFSGQIKFLGLIKSPVFQLIQSVVLFFLWFHCSKPHFFRRFSSLLWLCDKHKNKIKYIIVNELYIFSIHFV